MFQRIDLIDLLAAIVEERVENTTQIGTKLTMIEEDPDLILGVLHQMEIGSETAIKVEDILKLVHHTHQDLLVPGHDQFLRKTARAIRNDRDLLTLTVSKRIQRCEEQVDHRILNIQDRRVLFQRPIPTPKITMIQG